MDNICFVEWEALIDDILFHRAEFMTEEQFNLGEWKDEALYIENVSVEKVNDEQEFFNNLSTRYNKDAVELYKRNYNKFKNTLTK